MVRSPSTAMRLPSVIRLREACDRRTACYTVQRLSARLLKSQYWFIKHGPNDLTFDHVLPRAAGGVISAGEHRDGLQPCNMQGHAAETPPEAVRADGASAAAQRHFPPNFLHETWRDFLYWDVELEK
jgi:hypothetical protein